MITWDNATKTQLITIAMNEKCPLDFKYEALRELRLRWTNELLPELIKLYGNGLNMSDIASELGIDAQTVWNKLVEYGIYKRRVKS